MKNQPTFHVISIPFLLLVSCVILPNTQSFTLKNPVCHCHQRQFRDRSVIASSTTTTTTTTSLLRISTSTTSSKTRPGSRNTTNRARNSYICPLNNQQQHHDEEGDDDSMAMALTMETTTTTTTARNSLSSRRQALVKPFEMAFSSMILAGMATTATSTPLTRHPFIQLAMAEIQYNIPRPQTILMTGANSGIGYDAAKRMVRQGHTVLLLCRSMSKAKEAASSILDELNDEGDEIDKDQVIPKECNLADLKSIDRFVRELVQDERIPHVDALCLNAGVARNTAAKDVLRTAQNFELTVGTNHLGHFYLTDLILKVPQLMKEHGRIVVTASGVHDPESPGGAQGSKATLGDLKGLIRAVERGDGMFDMVDGNEMYDADKAYKDSKLCNVLFMRELQRRLDEEDKRKIQVVAFNPGLIVSTGLFRDQNPIFTRVFDFVATDVFRVGETVHWGGGALEYMALDVETVGSRGGGLYYTSPPGSSKFGDDAYGNQFTVAHVSKEASDMEKAFKLWELSEKLVRLQS